MRSISKDITWSRAIVILVGVSLLMALASGSAALAARKNPGGITVSGDSTQILDPSSDPRCESDAPLALNLTGSLEGCWSIFPDFDNATCVELNGFALYRETGREVFNGDLILETGEILSGMADTTYVFEAAFQSGFCTTFATVELAGGCIHYLKGRTDDFKGVTAQITFFDEIGPGGPTNFLYYGPLNIGGM